MRIRADFTQVAIVTPEHYHWVSSPRGEVERVMLDRIGTEAARATSLVKYPPNSVFPAHQHPYGEEILVLSGVFTENADGHYPAGWYLRSPHDSGHVPSSVEGALIFVKLRQMPVSETASLRINTNDPAHWQQLGERLICRLLNADYEQTYLEKLQPQQQLDYDAAQGIEILVIDGQLVDAEQQYSDGSWLRLPPKHAAQLSAGSTGATLYLKTGHLIAAIQSTAEQSTAEQSTAERSTVKQI